MRLKVADADTGSVGATMAPRMNAAGQLSPISSCPTTATAPIVTSTSAIVSEKSCAAAARSSWGDALKPDACSALGLDVDRVRSELADGVHEARVARDYESALASGVRGTPAFFTNGVHHEGAFDAGSLIEALEATAPAPARD